MQPRSPTNPASTPQASIHALTTPHHVNPTATATATAAVPTTPAAFPYPLGLSKSESVSRGGYTDGSNCPVGAFDTGGRLLDSPEQRGTSTPLTSWMTPLPLHVVVGEPTKRTF